MLLLQHFHATGTDVDASGLPPLHHGAARTVLRSADQYFHLISQKCGTRAADPPRVLREVFLTAYPDRLCRIRKGSADRGTMVGGRGVRLDKNSSVRHEEFFLAIDIDDSGSEVTVRAASAVEPQWLTGGSDWKKHVSVCDNLSFNQSKKRVEERRQVSWHGLILEESPRAVSNESVSLDLLFQQALRKPCEVLPAANTEAGEFMVRAKWLQHTLRESKSAQADRLMNICLDDEILIQQAKSRADGLRSFEDIRTMNWQSVFGRYL